MPGAQKQMYIAGTKLLETYAVPPLLNNQVLAIGVLPSLLRESLDELLEAAE